MSLLCRELSSLSPFSHSRFFSLSLDYIGLSDKDKNELTSPISLNKPVKFDGWVLSQISSWNGVAAESLIRFSTSISGHYNPTPKRGKKTTLPPCPSLPLRLPFFSSLFFLFLLQSEVKYRSSFGNGPWKLWNRVYNFELNAICFQNSLSSFCFFWLARS